MLTLDALGLTDWFAHQAERRDGCDALARVAAVDRGQLLLVGEGGFFRARLSGRFLHEAMHASQRPCVGDWVCVERAGDDGAATVQAVLDRQTRLRRKAPGESMDDQLIAANVDVVIIVQSCHVDFNLRRLERYLVMVEDGGAEPLILLTKTDLVAPDALVAQLDAIRGAGITARVVTLSNVTHEGMDELRRMLAPGRTHCFVGSSGVGKSTIINALVGRAAQETQDVSGTGEGRHTTVRRELILLDNGAMVIDNPGMREFGIFGADGGLEARFADILALAARCRFRDCTHAAEPGCAVQEAVARGDIGAEHYESFVKLSRESEYHEMSHAERRKKDRDFGRFIKSVKKDLEED